NKVPRPLVHKSSNQKQLERMLQSATREPPSLKHGSTKANFSQKSMCSPNNDVVVRAQVETYKANETFFISKITSLTFSEGTLVDNLPSLLLVDKLSAYSSSTTCKANGRSLCKLSTRFGTTTCLGEKAKVGCQQASVRTRMFYIFILLSLATSYFMILLPSLLFCGNCKRPEKSESHLPPPSKSNEPGSSDSGTPSKPEKSSDMRGLPRERVKKSKKEPASEKKSHIREQKHPDPSQESKESKEAKPKQPAVPDKQPVQPAAPPAPPTGGDEGYEACPDMTPEQLAKALAEMK
ncbi:hypothetical protein Y032_0295g1646, partial [Ancylostoma ceylanicum]